MFCLAVTVSAQETSYESLSEREAAVLLESRPLLVRLPGERNKIEALRRVLEEQPERSVDIEQRIARIEADRDRRNRILMNSMRSSYPYAGVLFFYDYDSVPLRDGTESVTFLDENLGPVSDSSVPEDYLVLHLGTKIGGGQSVAGAQLLDRNYRPLPFGFPDFSKEQTFASIFRSLGGHEQAERKNLERMVQRLNRKWEKYLD